MVCTLRWFHCAVDGDYEGVVRGQPPLEYLSVIPSTKVKNAAINLGQRDLQLCDDDTRKFETMGESKLSTAVRSWDMAGICVVYENADTEQTHLCHA